jgi:hypothetical protein
MNRDELFEEDLKFICEHLGSFIEPQETLISHENHVKRYEKHPEAHLFLQDILKALKQNEIFAIQLLAKWNTVKSHLIPLFITYPEDRSLTFPIVHIMTQLTMSIDVGRIEPEDMFRLRRSCFVFKQDLCEAYEFAVVSPFKVLVTMLLSPLENYEKYMVTLKRKNELSNSYEHPSIESQSTNIPTESDSDEWDNEDEDLPSDLEEREIKKSQKARTKTNMTLDETKISEKDLHMIELVLSLVRNILVISDDEDPNVSAQIQSKLIGFLDEYYVYELLFTLSVNLSDRIGRQFKFLLMEILYYTFFGCSPAKMFDTHHQEKQVNPSRGRVIMCISISVIFVCHHVYHEGN